MQAFLNGTNSLTEIEGANAAMMCQRNSAATCIINEPLVNNWTPANVQIKNLTGYATTSSNRVYLQLYYIFRNIRGFQWQEFVMGASLLLLLFALQFLSNRYPR